MSSGGVGKGGADGGVATFVGGGDDALEDRAASRRDSMYEHTNGTHSSGGRSYGCCVPVSIIRANIGHEGGGLKRGTGVE